MRIETSIGFRLTSIKQWRRAPKIAMDGLYQIPVHILAKLMFPFVITSLNLLIAINREWNPMRIAKGMHRMIQMHCSADEGNETNESHSECALHLY